MIEHAGFEHRIEGIGAAGRVKRAEKLLAHALAGEAAHRRGIAPAGVEARPVERRPAVARVEAEEAQHAQAVLGDALLGIADEAHAAGLQVGLAIEVIDRSCRRASA